MASSRPRACANEYWVHDDVSAALVAQRSGQRYEMGMNVQVKLMEATPVNGGLLFSMQSPPRPRRNDLKVPRREDAASAAALPANARSMAAAVRPASVTRPSKPAGGRWRRQGQLREEQEAARER